MRIEEMINYFSYDYAQPTGNAPIAPNMEVAAAPWNPSEPSGAHRDQGARSEREPASAEQPGVPDRCLRLDELLRRSCRW